MAAITKVAVQGKAKEAKEGIKLIQNTFHQVLVNQQQKIGKTFKFMV